MNRLVFITISFVGFMCIILRLTSQSVKPLVGREVTKRVSEPARSLLRDMYSTPFSQKQISREFICPSAVTKHIAHHFHFMHTVKAAEPESIRQPAQRRRKKRQRPDFDAPVFRLSALARVIRTQAAKKKGRKIDVDPAFPPEIRGVSDADLASTSAESPPARRPCVHQFKKVG